MDKEEKWVEEEEEGGSALKGRPPRHQVTISTDTTVATSTTIEQEERAELDRNFSMDCNDGDGDGDGGTVVADGVVGMKFSVVDHSISEKKLHNEELDLTTKILDVQNNWVPRSNHQIHENLKNEWQHGFNLVPHETSSENVNLSFKPVDKQLEEHTDIGFIKERHLAVIDLDVERVLVEQETHDLYCPNCNSCITRRVILRKRKRKVQNIQYDVKQAKIEKVDQSKSDDSCPEPSPSANVCDPVEPGVDGSLQPAVNDEDHGPDIFRCLSCFSLFTLTANGFKLFPCFGDRSNDENMQSVQQKPARSSNWFSSVFELIKGKRTGDAVRHVKGDADLNPQHSLAESETNQKTLTTENIVSSLPLTFLTGEEPDVNEKMKDPTELWTDEGATAKSDEAGIKLPGCTSSQEQVSYPKGSSLGDENSVPIESKKEALLLQDIQISIREDLDYAPRKITAGSPSYVMENIVPESMRNVLPHETEISICEQRSHETRRIHKWDVLNCIIYGGLIESIISLGVVSSAAGSDATTLNIAALGLANLISGFFVIVHNVRELKNDQNGGQTTTADDNVDRYQRVLGQRENFLLHIIVVMLSYLVFGSLPPVIYGFSFYKSNNKEYKLITVGVASLLCIFLLSIGKAHVQKPPRSYSKTIMYYVGIALTASGLSYVVGVLIKKLFAEVGWFDQSVTTSLHPLPVFLDTRVMIPQELISY
ncbi:PREDICTED: membrane protein of ER body-like protein isoform X3 [Nelumbo nucifera]|uniref:Membrane protein of ER body-like protein isoform X3 n=1 Tax=Nelumbo nucifera TaxID=4432 RepID=A0A1U7ZQ56_NELNU|nr:PREDICTED: membrane protein of ER body-like protein isoform X3 [Nelumbo nucifera]